MSTVSVIKFRFPESESFLDSILSEMAREFEDLIEIETTFKSQELATILTLYDVGVVFACVRNKEDLAELVYFLKKDSKILGKMKLKCFVFESYHGNSLEKILSRYGVTDILPLKFSAPAVKRKIDAFFKTIKPKKEDPQVPTSSILKNNEKKIQSFTSTSNDEPFDQEGRCWAPPLNLEDDFWLIENLSQCKKVMNSWVITITGPSSRIGKWEKINEGVWRFVVSEDEREIFGVNDGRWCVIASKTPEIDWDEKKWILRGSQIQLYYEIGSERFFKIHSSATTVAVSKNSLHAEMKRDLILDSFNEKFIFKSLNNEISKADDIAFDPMKVQDLELLEISDENSQKGGELFDDESDISKLLEINLDHDPSGILFEAQQASANEIPLRDKTGKREETQLLKENQNAKKHNEDKSKSTPELNSLETKKSHPDHRSLKTDNELTNKKRPFGKIAKPAMGPAYERQLNKPEVSSYDKKNEDPSTSAGEYSPSDREDKKIKLLRKKRELEERRRKALLDREQKKQDRSKGLRPSARHARSSVINELNQDLGFSEEVKNDDTNSNSMRDIDIEKAEDADTEKNSQKGDQNSELSKNIYPKAALQSDKKHATARGKNISVESGESDEAEGDNSEIKALRGGGDGLLPANDSNSELDKNSDESEHGLTRSRVISEGLTQQNAIDHSSSDKGLSEEDRPEEGLQESEKRARLSQSSYPINPLNLKRQTPKLTSSPKSKDQLDKDIEQLKSFFDQYQSVVFFEGNLSGDSISGKCDFIDASEKAILVCTQSHFPIVGKRIEFNFVYGINSAEYEMNLLARVVDVSSHSEGYLITLELDGDDENEALKFLDEVCLEQKELEAYFTSCKNW